VSYTETLPRDEQLVLAQVVNHAGELSKRAQVSESADHVCRRCMDHTPPRLVRGREGGGTGQALPATLDRTYPLRVKQPSLSLPPPLLCADAGPPPI